MMWPYVSVCLLLLKLSCSFPVKNITETGSDLGLYNPDNNTDVFEGDILRINKPSLSKNAIPTRENLWPYAAVIYKVEDNVGCPFSAQCKILMQAMTHYEKRSCIRFKEWSGESNYVSVFFNPDSSSCWSAVGMVGGEQKLSLGQRCWYLGIVIHELGHAIGFWHEMNRPDRDNWIYIFWENIIPNLRAAFNKHTPSQVNLLGEEFDYKSIMMYDEYAFSKDGVSPTLQAKDNEEIGPIWRKGKLSDVDVRRTKRLYECNGNIQKTSFPYDVLCTFEKHTCGFKDDTKTQWTWTKPSNSEGGYIHINFELTKNNPAEFESINFHGLSSSDQSRGPVGCISFSYLLMTDKSGYLRLSQAYLDSPHQLGFNPETTFDLWLEDKTTPKWKKVAIPLYVIKPFKLVFEGKFEEGTTYGTIGLDNIELSYNSCSVASNSINAPSPPVTDASTTQGFTSGNADSTTFISETETTLVTDKTPATEIEVS